MSEIATNRPNEHTVGVAAKQASAAVGPSDAKYAYVSGPATHVGTELCETLLNAASRNVEVSVGPCPAARMNARLSAKRQDLDARIIGHRGQPNGGGRGDRLERCVGFESGPGFVGLGKAQLGGGPQLDGKVVEQPVELTDLPLVVARQHPLFDVPQRHLARSKGSLAGGSLGRLG